MPRALPQSSTFAGFRIIDLKDYPDFKRRIKNLYGLRSEAIHRASFGHIQTSDLDDLSHWIAWIIISHGLALTARLPHTASGPGANVTS